jgi:hypothetical protein
MRRALAKKFEEKIHKVGQLVYYAKSQSIRRNAERADRRDGSTVRERPSPL